MQTNFQKNSRKIVYLDAAAGVSGDMFLGALTDVAASLDESFSLGRLVEKIELIEGESPEKISLSIRRETRGGIMGVKVDVHSSKDGPRGTASQHGHHHEHRNLERILGILERCDLPDAVREKSAISFKLLAEAEAKVHGVTPEEIHFHEVGAVDSIVDIIGAMLLMDHLGWPEVISSPVNVGAGTVRCSHGVLPVPAPATAELLKGMKIFSSGEPIERTTPTGAVLLRALAGENGFRGLPCGKILCTGTGLGSKDTKDIPNALRAIFLEAEGEERGRFGRDEPALVEANIDDMNSQDFAPVVDELFASGSLDVWLENIMMKKGRPAVKLCCLCRFEDAERFGERIIRNTTTLGVRITRTNRIFAERSVEEMETSLGKVRVKRARLDGAEIRKNPEFDDLLRISREKDIPLPELRKTIEREI